MLPGADLPKLLRARERQVACSAVCPRRTQRRARSASGAFSARLIPVPSPNRPRATSGPFWAAFWQPPRGALLPGCNPPPRATKLHRSHSEFRGSVSVRLRLLVTRYFRSRSRKGNGVTRCFPSPLKAGRFQVRKIGSVLGRFYVRGSEPVPELFRILQLSKLKLPGGSDC